MKILFSTLFLISLIACEKEEVGHTKSIFVNRTNHTIKLSPYSGNMLEANMLVNLQPYDSLIVFSDNVRGKTLDPSFGTLLQPYDSIVVEYDNLARIPHIKFNATYNGTHFIPFTSNRSISNSNNWEKVIENETSHSITGYYKYIFTEQDYLEAQ